ncbi:hypothetical protein LCGC14_2198020, partial [marine sediment metagenome]
MAEVNREDPQSEPNIVDPGASPAAPAVPATDTPPAEPLDARGVPYKNTVAELERKLSEAAAINQQYQTVLGERQAQQQAQAVATPVKPSGDDDVLAQYSDQDKQAIRILAKQVANEAAEQTGYRFMQQATLQNDLADNTELME